MQAVFVVLNKTEVLQDLLTKLKRAGVKGGTVFDSTGMISYIQDTDESYILGSLRLFLETARPDSKTMFFVVNDDQLDIIFKTVDEAVGGIAHHDTGIIFAIPVTRVEGLIKV